MNIATLPTTHVPDLFPIPQRGQDPYFGLARSFYYDLEKRGIIRLIRLRKPGNIRGKVLIPYAETAAALRKLAREQSRARPADDNHAGELQQEAAAS